MTNNYICRRNSFIRGGFTLVEVLLGLLIFSVIATGLYATFRSSLDVNRRVKIINAQEREVRWIWDQMARDFENMVGYDFSGSYPQVRAFEGRLDFLRFIVPSEQGLEMVTYQLHEPHVQSITTTVVNRPQKKMQRMLLANESAEPPQSLVRIQQPLMEYVTQAQTSKSEVLTLKVPKDGFKIRYAPAKGNINDEAVWLSSWDKDVFPAMIKVELQVIDAQSSQKRLLTREFFVPLGK